MMREHYGEVMVLKPEMGTPPHVFYLDMDERFVSRPDAKPAIWDVRDQQGEEIGYEFSGH